MVKECLSPTPFKFPISLSIAHSTCQETKEKHRAAFFLFLSFNMEKHKCKLCSRTFNNGRALGGHMKSHLATSTLTRKKTLGAFQAESASSSSSSSGNKDEKPPVYGLRENPKKSCRVADPEFSFANLDSGSSVVVVPDNEESETESKNPSRRRSKRIRTSGLELEKQKIKKIPSLNESTTESPVSSVSDTSPEEDLAVCLMMLSRGVWKKNTDDDKQEATAKEGSESTEMLKETQETSLNKTRSEFRCEKCNKVFGSYRSLGRHKTICSSVAANEAIFKCPFCAKMFTSGQALGGHKRSHLAGTSTSTTISAKPNNLLIDLNLPAPLDDDFSSVVS